MKLLVTGGCGFIGANFVRSVLAQTDAAVINYDAMTYAGNPANVAGCTANPRYTFVPGNICDKKRLIAACGDGVDAVVNFAAESHVDRSIADPQPFVETNIIGVSVILDVVRELDIPRFLHVSTDEVYGSLEEGAPAFVETDPLLPNSPYAASKAAADLLCRAYYKTFGVAVVIVRCTNNYGPCQHSEKLIPRMIAKALAGEPLPIYGDGSQIRDWIHVDDHCAALRLILEKGKTGSIYNVSGRSEKRNIEVVKRILQILGKPSDLIVHVDDRPAHDRRYALNAGRLLSEFGWQPAVTFDQGLEKTVVWYQGRVPRPVGNG